MRADDYIRILVASNQREKSFLLSRRGSERNANPKRIEPAPQHGIMLLSQNLCRRHKRGWKPDSTASRIAAMATTVLPEPTSPCNRRFMGRPAARSRL